MDMTDIPLTAGPSLAASESGSAADLAAAAAAAATTTVAGNPAPAPLAGSGYDLDVAVIGAGPHGLSAATHLRRAGVAAHVFGKPMSFWKQMPEGMMLRSNMSATNMIETSGPLSLASFTADTGRPIEQPVPLEDFIAYGSWVQQRAVPDLDERDVTSLERAGEGFSLSLQDGTQLSARRVVIACGIAPFERFPDGFDHLPGERISHTARHRDLGAFAGQRVAVIGGGQSAFECAVLMHERGAANVEVLIRKPRVVWLRGHGVKKRIGALGPIVYAPTDVGPLWYSRLVEKPDILFRRLPRATQNRIAARSIRPACSNFVKVRLDPVHISTGVDLVRAQADGQTLTLTLSDGSTRAVDHLMFGTGYKVDVARYPFLGERIVGQIRRVDGYPVLSSGLESSVPGLHFAGAPASWSFGPIMRFVSGSWYSGSSIAREIAQHSPRRAVTPARAASLAQPIGSSAEQPVGSVSGAGI
jgi:FAD-dependent urate hydroxylase